MTPLATSKADRHTASASLAPNAMPDEHYLARYLRAAADYAEAPHGPGVVHIAPQTAARWVLPQCMWPAEARYLAYTLGGV